MCVNKITFKHPWPSSFFLVSLPFKFKGSEQLRNSKGLKNKNLKQLLNCLIIGIIVKEQEDNLDKDSAQLDIWTDATSLGHHLLNIYN